MNIQRGRLVSGGRIQVPAEIRRALDLHDGDAVTMEVVDGELRIRPLRETLARVRSELRQYIPADVSLSEELIANRRAAAAKE